MAHGNNTIPIPGELRSEATEGVVASADAIKDYKKGKFQEQVNEEVSTEINNIKGGSTDSISSLKTAISTEKSRAQGAESTLQNNINAERTRAEGIEALKANASDVYTKAQGTAFEGEVNNTISQQNTNIANKFAQQDQVIDERLDAQDEKIDTILQQKVEVVDALPETGEEGIIYRVTNQEGNGYSDYMWQDETFKLIGTFGFPGIDDEPTEDSPNVVKSGGIAAYYGSYKESPEFIKVELDEEDKVLEAIREDGIKLLAGGAEIYGKTMIHGEIESDGSVETVIDNLEFIDVETDGESKLLEARKVDGTKVFYSPVEIQGVTQKTIENPEFLQVITDDKDKKLWWIDKDGNIDWSLGVPTPIKEYFGDYMPFVEGDFTPNMTRNELVILYNSKLTDFCALCKCNIDCMELLDINDSDEVLYEKVNGNFREDVIKTGMTQTTITSQLNKYFQIPIYRFSDIKLNISNNIDNSLIVPPFSSYAYEPSALISDDGERIELYNASNSRSTSIDGIHWTEPVSLVISGNPNWASHTSVNKVDGIYVMIGCAGGGDHDQLSLYTSNDGINFTKRGVLFEANNTIIAKINGVDTVCTGWGNTYLFKDGGVYYLFYECLIRGWEICLATCTDLFADQGDGFIGNWTQCDINPIIPRTNVGGDPTKPIKPGNPEIVKGTDNRPLKHNGNYYMYYHAMTGDDKGPIYRAHSKDLVHWITEGKIFDNRDLPTLPRGTNSDHAMCEFKGRSYLFYTHNINNYEGPNHTADLSAISIRVTCDDRPLHDLLKIRA